MTNNFVELADGQDPKNMNLSNLDAEVNLRCGDGETSGGDYNVFSFRNAQKAQQDDEGLSIPNYTGES